MPSSSSRVCRSRRYAASASACRPPRYSASISWAWTCSSNGCSAASRSSSGTSSRCSPTASRASASARLIRPRSRSSRSACSSSQASPATSASGAPAPQRQRLAQVAGAADRIGGLRPLPQQPLGEPDVGAVLAGVEQVTGRPGQDRRLVPQHPAQVGHVTLQRVQRGRGALAPNRVDQAVGADDLAAVQRQRRQHRLAAQAADRPDLSVDDDLDRPEQPNLHDGPPFSSAQPPRLGTAGGSLRFKSVSALLQPRLSLRPGWPRARVLSPGWRQARMRA